MIQLTDNALAAARSALTQAGATVQGLRVAVHTGGCAGFKYAMGLVREAEPGDILVEQEDVRLFIDPESGRHLPGTVMDFVDSAQGAGFTFANPNASGCGCGRSFC
jgi:iron-sulfur cluster assembly accessory protein